MIFILILGGAIFFGWLIAGVISAAIGAVALHRSRR